MVTPPPPFLHQVMDTPMRQQIRAAQPDVPVATQEDTLELVEMILGALGQDAVGIGASMAHPRESEQWKGMDFDQKIEFFAPIWRVMRDAPLSVEEVKEQVQHVALVTKQASNISDLRHHYHMAPRTKAPLVYFRAKDRGMCTYMDDGRLGAHPHGLCWYDLCEDIEVIDLPGDHFSVLRQDDRDMNLIVTALKVKLAPFGWTEILNRGGRRAAASSLDIPDIDAYLQKMGVKDPALRKRVEAQLPGLDEEAVTAAMEAVAAEHEVAPLNAGARALTLTDGAWGAAPVLVVCADANGGTAGLEPVLAALEMPAFVVKLPQDSALLESPSVPELARLCTKALRAHVPASRRLVLAGVGFGAVVAHELALQAAAASDRVLGLVLLEGRQAVRASALAWLPPARAAEVGQVASLLYPTVQAAAEEGGAAGGAPGVEAFATRLGSIQGFDGQLDYIALFRPHHVRGFEGRCTVREGGVLGGSWAPWRGEGHAFSCVCQEGARWLTTRQLVKPSLMIPPPYPNPSPLGTQEKTKDWDERINALLSRLAYFSSICAEYRPSDVFLGQTLAVTCGPPAPIGTVHAAWESIAFLVQPLESASLGAGARSGVSPGTALATELQGLLWDVVRRAEERAAQASETAQTPSASTARVSRRISVGAASEALPGGDGPVDTYTLVLPLNRLCPERRYILRRATALHSGTPAALAAAPLTRIPLWMLHGERGDLSSAQKELAALLPLPVYGLAMGPDADACATLAELAARYAAALRVLQPAGPYLLLGSSVGGVLLAHALACALRAEGAAVALVLVDGCVGAPALPLHDVSWYALFYLLREIGGLRGSMGEFVDVVRGAGSPAAQLKLLNSFRPPELADAEEAWDAAVYTTLDRAGLLKRLSRGPAATPPGVFDGPVATLLPEDRIGALFLAATTPHCDVDRVLSLGLTSRHTECLLTDRARRETAAAVVAALKSLLPQL